MSTGRFAKRDREKARQERAAAKRARRFGPRDDDAPAAPPAGGAPARPQSDVLAALAALHEAYEAERISFDDFEQTRADLMAQLHVS